jgi:16S rRNA (uracil1498-N3)-methyltransferase
MILFYTQKIEGDLAFLEEEEARHCAQVLRRKPGDAVSFVDGAGTFYEGKILETSKKACAIQIMERKSEPQRDFTVHIAIAPTKSNDRFEWFLEKATEIGIDEITPLLCAHSERRKIRHDRLEKVLIAAMKQSLKATLPRLHELTSLEDFIANAQADQRFIAHLDETPTPHLQEACSPKRSVLVLIGPEGDFSPTEIALAQQHNFQSVSLGPSRLRTETAGVVACHIVNLKNEPLPGN